MKHGISRFRRAGIGAVAAVTTIAGLAPLAASPAGATSAFKWTREFGADRYATAAAIATDTFTTGADNAVIATGEKFPDALSGNYVAGAKGGPILLVQQNAAPQATLDALKAVKVKNVYLMGGTDAISAGVETTLKGTDSTNATGGKLNVIRVAGADRYATAAIAAATGGTVGNLSGKKTALLATGEKFADALSGGPIAWSQKFPVILTNSTGLNATAKKALTDNGIQHVIILGGNEAIAASADSDLTSMGITSQRLFGADRFATSVAVANFAMSTLGFKNSHAGLARGDDPNGFADALAAGPHGGKEDPTWIVLTNPTTAVQAITDFFAGLKASLTSGHAFGGVQAIADSVLATYATAAGAGGSNQSLSATPAGTTIVTFTRTAEGGTGIKNQTVTFGGLNNATKYDVALFPCASPDTQETGNGYSGPNVIIGSNGQVTFRDADTLGTNGNPDNQADNEGESTDFDLDIVSVNGSSINSRYADAQTPDNGSLSVVVSNANDSDYGDCAFAVAWNDANNNNELDLDANNAPTEAFATTGAMVWASHEAPDGESSSYDIVWMDKATNTLYTDSSEGYFFKVKSIDTSVYDDNTFAMTPTQFLKDASLGDSFDFFTGGYSRTGPSVFDLYSDTLAAPSNVVATQGNFDGGTTTNDVKVTWTAPTDGEFNHYEVFRDGTGPIPCWINSTTSSTVPTTPSCIDSNPAAGSHSYRVSAVSKTNDDSDRSEPATFGVSTPPPGAKAGAPLSTSAVHTDGNVNGKVDNGDVLVFDFDEPLAQPIAGDTITLADKLSGGAPTASSTVGSLINGSNATFALQNNNTRLVVIVGAPGPAISTNGDDAQLTYADNTSVIATSNTTNPPGVKDADEGLAWNVAASPDRTV